MFSIGKLTSWANYILSSYSDFECPKCGSGHEINWNTEYGEPYDGKYIVECLNCTKKFLVTVCTITTYEAEEISHG